MRTIDLRASHSGLEPVVSEFPIDAFLLQQSNAAACKKRAATRKVSSILHEFEVVDLRNAVTGEVSMLKHHSCAWLQAMASPPFTPCNIVVVLN